MIANRMRAALDKGDDHAAVLTHFLGTLTPAEQSVVRRLLGKQRRGGAS
jgi:hypothetical protein